MNKHQEALNKFLKCVLETREALADMPEEVTLTFELQGVSALRMYEALECAEGIIGCAYEGLMERVEELAAKQAEKS